MDRIREGVRRFQREVFPELQHLYEEVAAHQRPCTLFLTCGDSRIHPEQLTQSGPGEIFVERNPGNFVPVYDDKSRVGVSASIEFAIEVLDVARIIVCGHSDCGAMKTLLHPEKLAALPAVGRWLSWGAGAIAKLNELYPNEPEKERLRKLTEINVLEQMGHLKTHPSVTARLEKGAISIYGWVYEIHTGRVDAYNPETGVFEPFPGED